MSIPQRSSLSFDVDAIVIGGGLGGATFAYACAKAGKSVLLLERGSRFPVAKYVLDEQAMPIDKKPYDDRLVAVNGISKRLLMGGVLGGGSAVYGGALLRPAQNDFHPGKYYGDRIPREIWDWPVTYDTLEPYYTKAEKLFGVAGADDENLAPLGQPENGYLNKPLPLHPINQRMIDACRSHGLRPFQLPLAIDPQQCLRCGVCAGYICPTGARRSSLHLLEELQDEKLDIEVQTGIEVERLNFNSKGEAIGVEVRDRKTGKKKVYRAQCYGMGAGAIASPMILQRSELAHPLIGRNYMKHCSPIVIGFFPRQTKAEDTFVKQIGFSDFYFGTKNFPYKMGCVQSLSVPEPLLIAKNGLGFLPLSLLESIGKHILPMTGCVEDLPNPENRVTISACGEPQLQHHYDEFDYQRSKVLAQEIARILKYTGALFCLTKTLAPNEHVGHQCGTLRFGTAPAHAVLDSDCRMFGTSNVFTVDGSFFPTSLGVNPGLTIIANALRVADIVIKEI